MDEDFNFLLEIVKVSNRRPESPYYRTMEECSELSIECSKHERGIGDPDKMLEEMSDVFFSMLRIMEKRYIHVEDLVKHAIEKTREKFPEQIEEVESAGYYRYPER